MNKKINSKEKIIETASKLFQINGYNATGMNEILKESSSPKGSLYYYFPNGKEELAIAAIKMASKTIQNKITTGMNKSTDPTIAIQNVIDGMIEALNKNGNLQTLSISLISLETCLSSDILQKVCAESFTKLENLYANKLIAAGFSEKTATELGITIQIMIEGALTISITQKETIPLSIISKQITVLLEQYHHK